MLVYIHDPLPNRFSEFVAGMQWTLTPQLKDAQVVIFTGGADVNPKLYGAPRHITTRFDDHRDSVDRDMYNYCLDNQILMVGICRGGQFLNVMAGGDMIQDMNGHAISGKHTACLVDLEGEILEAYKYEVTSTHHQMMIPTDEGIVYAAAMGVGSNYAMPVPPVDMKGAFGWKRVEDIVEFTGNSLETECVGYLDLGLFCFQPHPEYDPEGDTMDLFKECFDLFLTDLEGSD